MSDIPLTDLRSLACRGDKDAYGRLVKQHVGLVFGVCMGVLGDRHEAEDATQQVFLKGFTEIGKLKNSEQFAAWVCRIGRNLCIDIVRRRELERNAIKTHVRKNKDDASERFLSLESALGRLPEKYRVVLMLFYFDECKSKRIGQVLGISESAVHMRLMRARQELRKILENEREL